MVPNRAGCGPVAGPRVGPGRRNDQTASLLQEHRIGRCRAGNRTGRLSATGLTLAIVRLRDRFGIGKAAAPLEKRHPIKYAPPRHRGGAPTQTTTITNPNKMHSASKRITNHFPMHCYLRTPKSPSCLNIFKLFPDEQSARPLAARRSGWRGPRFRPAESPCNRHRKPGFWPLSAMKTTNHPQ